MTFLQPLWLLATPLALLIVALHIRRRTTLRVGSTGLWQRIADTSTSRFVWRLPPITAALIFQLLAFLLVVTALARPTFDSGASHDNRHRLVVLDTSGSMAARRSPTDDRTRLDAAKAYLRELASASSTTTHTETFSLLTAGVRTDARVVRTENRADLAKAASAVEDAGGTVAWDDVVRRAQALADPVGPTAVLVLTDGAEGDRARTAFEAVGLGDRLEVVAFGVPVDNVALVDAHIEPVDEEGTPTVRLAGTIARHVADPDPVPLEIWFTPDGTSTPLPWHEEEVTGDGASLAFSFDLELPGSGLVEVRLPRDASPADDVWVSRYRATPREAEILVVGPGDPALERALASIDHVRVSRSAGLPEDSASYDLVVVDGLPVQRHPGTSTLWIASEPTPTEVASSASATRWDRAHPVSGSVDWTRLEDVSIRAGDLPQGASPLVQAADRPMVWARTTAAGRDVGLAFDPTGHAWTSTLGFPVFIDNIVRWAVPDLGRVAAASCRVGTLCALRPERLADGAVLEPLAGSGPVQVIPSPFVSERPDAMPHERWMPRGIEAGFVPDRPGAYRVGAETVSILAASPSEADLRVGADRDTGAVRDDEAPETVGLDLAKLAAALAVALLIAEAVLAWRSDPRVATSRTRMLRLVSLRAAAVLLVCLALFDAPLPEMERIQRSVVVLDDPALMTADARERALGTVDATSPSPSGAAHAHALIASGPGEPMSDMPAPAQRENDATASAPPDLAAVLDTAQAWLGGGDGGRIVLATNATVSSAALTHTWQELAQRGTVVEYLPVAYDSGGDVAVSDVRAPTQTAPGIPFTVRGTLRAAEAQSIEVALLRDGEPVDVRPLDLAPGATDVVFEREGEPVGEHVYEIAARANGGSTANDRDGAVVEVGGSARIALVTQRPEAASLLRDVLANAGLASEVLSPDDLPYRLPDLLPYDVVMLLDVPAVALHSVQQESLETWVREHGGGLVIGGGRNTFGPGGYYQTPLEAASPLSSRIPGEAPQVALLFILDRSGSMTQQVGGVSRLAIAKQATADAAALLDEESSVGIIVFDELARVLFPLQSVANLDAMEGALAPLDAAGGTSMYPALLEAVDQFATIDASAKHIVLMSDGLSEPGDFRGVVETLRTMGVTVSTVAIGQGADTQVLSSIASWGGGAFHATTDFRALPSILAQETLLLSGTPIEELAFDPAWTNRDAAFLEGLPDALPALAGFVRTSAKDGATVHIAGLEDAPILASWRHGLGRTVAFTSEAAGAWIQPWLASEAYPLLWSQVARWVVPPVAKPGLHARAVHDADVVRVAVTAVAEDGSPASGLRLVASLRDEEGATTRASLVESSAGRYVGDAPARSTGLHVVSVREEAQDSAFEPVEARVYVSYPAPLRIGATTAEAARGLALLTGGRTLLGGEAPPPGSVATRWGWNPAWTPWLVAALALFLLELLLRYGRAWLRTIGRFGRRWVGSRPVRTPERGATSPR